jgi:hypothetical protein
MRRPGRNDVEGSRGARGPGCSRSTLKWGVSNHMEPPWPAPLASSWMCAQTSSITHDTRSGRTDGAEALIPVIPTRGLRLVLAVRRHIGTAGSTLGG